MSIRLRDARFEDHAAVAALLTSQGLTSASPEQWEHLWRNNPVLEGARAGLAMGWVLERDGEIGGYLGNIVTESAFGERTLTTAVTTALAVAEGFRSHTLMLITRFYKQKGVDLYLCTTANDQSGPVLEAFKALRVPQPKLDRVAFWVVNPGAMSAAALRRVGAGPLAAAAGLLGIVGPAWNAMHRPPRPSQDLSVGHLPIETIGAPFDRLWADVRSGEPRIMGDRSATALRWHFGSPAGSDGTRLLACQRGSELAGYLTTRDETGLDEQLLRTRITDFVVARRDAHVARSLLWHAFEDARMRRRHVLELRRAAPWIRAIAEQGRPFERAVSHWPCLYRSARSFDAALDLEARWELSDFDGDSSL